MPADCGRDPGGVSDAAGKNGISLRLDESYFYDAVCTGKSLCDGYSNMLSILFHLIGVECCEAMGQDNDGQSGHTWVVAKLDGEFYNFDPTFEDTGEVPPGQRLFLSVKTIKKECLTVKIKQL